MDVLGEGGLECARGDARCGGDRDKCKKNAGNYMGEAWDICPVRAVQDDECLLRVINLERDSKLTPISGWPNEYVAWVSSLWAEYRSKINEREAARLKNVSKT